MILKDFEYVNWSPLVFEGFYNTIISGDMELEDITYNDISEGCIEEGNHYEITNYGEYKEEVAKRAVTLLSCACADSTIHNFKLTKVYSPKYYNFETDKLGISMTVDTDMLEWFCFDNSSDFNKYLNDTFSSRDGFISFIPNNIIDFNIKYRNNEKKGIELEVMIEYYILCKLNKTTNSDKFTNENDYTCALHESISEIVLEQAEVVSD